MNRQLAKKLKKGQQQQAQRIRNLGDFDRVKREFDIEYEVAREVTRARQEAGLTQRQLAEAMGTTQSVISRIERGSNISIETLDRYVAACGQHLRIQIV